MKKRMKLLSILLLVVFMSGCVKYNYTMEIGSDKSVMIEIIDAIAVDYESYGSYETEATAAEAKGFTKEDYKTDDWIGYKLTKKYDNIDDISSEEAVTVELSDILNDEKDDIKVYFQKKKSLFKTTYVANFTITIEDSSYSDDEEETTEEDTEEDSDDGTDLSYKVILPVKADSSNATSKSEDEKELSWDLTYGDTTEIKYEFSMVNTMMYIVVAAVAAIIVIGVIFVVTSSKKKNKGTGSTNMNTTVPNQPMNNGMPNPSGEQPNNMTPQMMPQEQPQSFINQDMTPNMMGPNLVDQNPLGDVAFEQPMANNTFAQQTPDQAFMPAGGTMPSLENQPPIINQPEMSNPTFDQPAPFPEVNIDAAPEVAPVDVPMAGTTIDNDNTVVMPPVVEEPTAQPTMEVPEQPLPTIGENNNNIQ